jgi:type I restriction enzyme R subunit
MESEWSTRRLRIDKRLTAAGWDVRGCPSGDTDRLSSYPHCAITEYPTANGPADYALVNGGEVVGIVEGKRVRTSTMTVLGQAERYSKGLSDTPLEHGEFGVPFLYSTNGEQIWFEDVRQQAYRSRQIAAFHTPAAVAETLARDTSGATAWLRDNQNVHPLRPYQIEAIEAVEQALISGKRQMLVSMATGTGKTFTAVSLIYRLLRSGLARRVLFLVDRRSLAAQAVRAFASFEAEPNQKFDRIYEVYSQRFQQGDFEEGQFDPKVLPHQYLTNPGPGHTFVYVSTIQRMAINLFGRERAFQLTGDAEAEEDAADKLDIPIHAFDVVIADECHRGYTAAEQSVWRGVLEHFDAVRIGLTATPALHTTAYFMEIAYTYPYERAVAEGYLVDYDAVAVRSGVLMEGVFLREGEQVEQVDSETGARQLDLLEDERAFDASEVERKVTAPDANRRVVAEVARYAREFEARSGRFPKTLIFAINDLPHTSHADQLVRLCRDQFGRGDAFVQKITGSPSVDRPLQRIREFRNRPLPGVVVTVDMLSTGVDIPALEFIVLLRPVKSRILFTQMLGRGTRLCDEIGKSHFTVFDCFDGTLLEYFKNTTDFTIEPPEKPTRGLAEIVEDIWQNRDRDYNVRSLAKRLWRIEREMSGEARDQFVAWIPDGDVGGYADRLSALVQREFAGTMKVLRDPGFQELCLHYPMPRRSFVVASGVRDVVTSEYVFRTTDGRELKPHDYLAAFEQFVHDHERDVDAIAVLLDRPSGWNTERLTELRRTLARAPERFTDTNLRRAYRSELADIISMVHVAALKERNLLTAAERAERAIATVSEGRKLSDEQRLWLGRIGRHLAENLTIDPADFETMPVFADIGGWGRANRVFSGQLEPLLRQCNEAMAA